MQQEVGVFSRVSIGMVLIGLLLVTSASAEMVVRGRVTDAETKEPLPQGTIQILGTYEGTYTNRDGV